MRYLLNNKVYDTEKAEKILTYIKPIEYTGIFGYHSYPKYRHTLYKTNKENFFVHIGEYVGKTDVAFSNKDEIKLISDEEVKDILNQLNEVEIYKKLFNDLEEG